MEVSSNELFPALPPEPVPLLIYTAHEVLPWQSSVLSSLFLLGYLINTTREGFFISC